MLINYESPLERNLYLNLDSDNMGAVEEGQGSEPVESFESEVSEEVEAPSYFYSYESDDGNKTDFKDTKELNEYIRSGTLRHGDYTRKTQEVASQRKALEADRAKYDAEFTTFLQQRQEQQKVEEMLKTLPPEVYERLKQGIKSQLRQQELKDPRVDQLLKENEAKQKQAEEDSMRTAAIDSLSRSYPDFNKDSVMEAIKQLEEIAPGDHMRAFMELLHFAGKGRTSPAQIEQATVEALKKKQAVTTPMSGTHSTPSRGKTTFASLDEAAEAAYNNL